MPIQATRDKAQEIIEIAKRVQDSGVYVDNFKAVFDAIARVEYLENVEITINGGDMSRDTAQEVLAKISKQIDKNIRHYT